MSSSDQILLFYISAIGGLVSAVASVLATIAAFRAAGAAKTSALHAQATERRQVVHDVVAIAHNIVSDARRIDDIAGLLKLRYSDLFRHAGQPASSREKLFVEEVEKKRQQVSELKDVSSTYAANPKLLDNISDAELSTLSTTIHGQQVEVNRLRLTLEQELESVERELQTYREKALRDPS